MSNPWPTESGATAAVEAAARSLFEKVNNTLLTALPPTQEETLPEWDDQSPVEKLKWRELALPMVWAALEALPDPRFAAWEMGYGKGYSQGCYDSTKIGIDPIFDSGNPFPS